jgi:hypothetical protein
MSDQTKPTEQPHTGQPQEAAKAQTKRRVEEYMAQLASNPQFNRPGLHHRHAGRHPPKPPGES